VVQPPYTVAVRLLYVAAGDWAAFDGELASRGVRPIRLPFRTLLNLIYSRIIRNADEDKGGRTRIDAELMEPLPGFVPREKQRQQIEADAAEQEMALFMKAASQQ
jgi:hypothetical protein